MSNFAPKLCAYYFLTLPFYNHIWNLTLNSDCVFTVSNVGQEKKLNDDIGLLYCGIPQEFVWSPLNALNH